MLEPPGRPKACPHGGPGITAATDGDDGDGDRDTGAAVGPRALLASLQRLLRGLEPRQASCPSDSADDRLDLMLSRTARHRIGILGRGGAGKSFVLNLLLLLTFAPRATPAGGDPNAHERRQSPLEAERDYDNCEVQRISEPDLALYGSLRERRAEHECGVEQIKSVVRERSSTSSSSGGHLDIGFRPFLLPDSSRVKPRAAVPIRVRYGAAFHVALRFKSQDETRALAFRHCADVASLDGGGDDDHDHDARSWNALRYNVLTGFPQRRSRAAPPEALAKTRDDVKLSMRVAQRCGRTVVHAGSGSNPDVDRAYIRDLLARAMLGEQRTWTPDGTALAVACADWYHLDEVVVYAPCSVLGGRTEFVELPAADSTDPVAADVRATLLSQLDLVWCLLPRALGEEPTVLRALRPWLQHVSSAATATSDVALVKPKMHLAISAAEHLVQSGGDLIGNSQHLAQGRGHQL